MSSPSPKHPRTGAAAADAAAGRAVDHTSLNADTLSIVLKQLEYPDLFNFGRTNTTYHAACKDELARRHELLGHETPRDQLEAAARKIIQTAGRPRTHDFVLNVYDDEDFSPVVEFAEGKVTLTVFLYLSEYPNHHERKMSPFHKGLPRLIYTASQNGDRSIRVQAGYDYYSENVTIDNHSVQYAECIRNGEDFHFSKKTDFETDEHYTDESLPLKFVNELFDTLYTEFFPNYKWTADMQKATAYETFAGLDAVLIPSLFAQSALAAPRQFPVDDGTRALKNFLYPPRA